MKTVFLPLKIIQYIKKTIHMKNFKQWERTSGFGENCIFDGRENISVGENTWFGMGCELYAYNSHFEQKLNSQLVVKNNVRVTARCRITCAGKIGNDVLIGPDVFITDHNHGTIPGIQGGYSKQPLVIKHVIIEDGVWLGQRVCVLSGVRIGKYSIIGANSVVTHDIPEYCMAVGTPAKVIKCWNKEKQMWEKV